MMQFNYSPEALKLTSFLKKKTSFKKNGIQSRPQESESSFSVRYLGDNFSKVKH